MARIPAGGCLAGYCSPPARCLRQNRDEHHHGLHALAPLSSEPVDRHARPRHRQQPGQVSPPTAPEFTGIVFSSRPYIGDLRAQRFAPRRCGTCAYSALYG
jgi:hypothetical protein